MENATELIRRGEATTEDALRLFDQLQPADIELAKGRWHGAGFLTGHPMDGMLEAFNWYGKEFVDEERVHPLLFRDFAGKIFVVHPGRLPMTAGLRLPVPKIPQMKYIFLLLKPLLRTRQYRARMRMLEYRGTLSVAMIYDDLPIIDVFRKIDDDNLLGIMDLRGIERPFFFRLTREA